VCYLVASTACYAIPCHDSGMQLSKGMQTLQVRTDRMKPTKHRTPPATVRFLSDGVSRFQTSAYTDMLVLLSSQLSLSEAAPVSDLATAVPLLDPNGRGTLSCDKVVQNRKSGFCSHAHCTTDDRKVCCCRVQINRVTQKGL
jgi:hypothetical protein